MIDIILFVGFFYLFIDTATSPPPKKRVVRVYKPCVSVRDKCNKRVLVKRRPFLPHEVMRGIRD